MARVVGVRFRRACKLYDFNANGQDIHPGDRVIVEVDRGLGMGTVADEPVEKDEKSLSYKLKKVIRKADQVDMDRQQFNHEREDEAYKICKEKIKDAELEMKLIRVEYLFDSSKAIFYFTSDGRIDFRVLVKDLASLFHTRIEMRQIGVRDEAKVVGGMGPCGRELCCTNFLSNFAPVTVKMAKEQNLALNPTKISGLCGRLMCCLSYEYQTYKKGSKGKAGVKHAPAASGGGGGCCGSVPRSSGAGGTGGTGGPDEKKGPTKEEGRKKDERSAGADTMQKPASKEGAGPSEEKKADSEARPGGEERPKREKRSRRGRRRGRRNKGDRNARESGQKPTEQKSREEKTGVQSSPSPKKDGQDNGGGGGRSI